jgi:pimeloyl-ACP methyl ester carboxylesterase
MEESMKKKRLFVFLVVSIALSGVIIGCQDPTIETSVDGQYPIASGPKLKTLEVTDSSHTAKLSPPFNPNIFDYEVVVSNVCQGLNVAATTDEGNIITLWGEHGLDEKVFGMQAAPAGKPMYFPEGTATIILNNDKSGPKTVQSYVYVADEEASNTYSIKIVVEDKRHIQGYFVKSLGWLYDPDNSYIAADGNAVGSGSLNGDEFMIRYNIYVPVDVAENEQLPVVYVLHGAGGFPGDADAILRANEDATIWAKDSRKGHNRAIVVQPQASSVVNGSSAWATVGPVASPLASGGEAGYQLLKAVIDGKWEVMGKNHTVARTIATFKSSSSPHGLNSANAANNLGRKTGVKGNPKRVYVLGQSMGGGGTIAVIRAYPETFAAAIPICAAGLFDASDFTGPKGPALKKVAIKFVHDYYDPTVNYTSYHVANWNIVSNVTGWRVPPTAVIHSSEDKIEYLYPTHHQSWELVHRNKAIRDWLFAQSLP